MGGQTLCFSFGKPLLLMLPLLVIQLVGGFEGATWNQTGRKAWLVGGEGGQHLDTRIQSDKEILIYLCRFHFSPIDHLDHIMLRFGHDSDLLDVLGVLFGFYEPPTGRNGYLPLI